MFFQLPDVAIVSSTSTLVQTSNIDTPNTDTTHKDMTHSTLPYMAGANNSDEPHVEVKYLRMNNKIPSIHNINSHSVVEDMNLICYSSVCCMSCGPTSPLLHNACISLKHLFKIYFLIEDLFASKINKYWKYLKVQIKIIKRCGSEFLEKTAGYW